MTKIYKLTRPARGKGGDRYENHESDCPVNVLYVNQEFSRQSGTPLESIEVSFNANVASTD